MQLDISKPLFFSNVSVFLALASGITFRFLLEVATVQLSSWCIGMFSSPSDCVVSMISSFFSTYVESVAVFMKYASPELLIFIGGICMIPRFVDGRLLCRFLFPLTALSLELWCDVSGRVFGSFNTYWASDWNRSSMTRNYYRWLTQVFKRGFYAYHLQHRCTSTRAAYIISEMQKISSVFAGILVQKFRRRSTTIRVYLENTDFLNLGSVSLAFFYVGHESDSPEQNWNSLQIR